MVITAQKLMSVVINISKTYYKPNQTYTKLFAAGASEKENLAYLVGGCVISFVAQWPAQSRQAFINQQPVDELMGAILLSNLFLLPLIFYLVSAILFIFAKTFKSNILGVELRLIIFWSYLIASGSVLSYPISPDGRRRIANFFSSGYTFHTDHSALYGW